MKKQDITYLMRFELFCPSKFISELFEKVKALGFRVDSNNAIIIDSSIFVQRIHSIHRLLYYYLQNMEDDDELINIAFVSTTDHVYLRTAGRQRKFNTEDERQQHLKQYKHNYYLTKIKNKEVKALNEVKSIEQSESHPSASTNDEKALKANDS